MNLELNVISLLKTVKEFHGKYLCSRLEHIFPLLFIYVQAVVREIHKNHKLVTGNNNKALKYGKLQINVNGCSFIHERNDKRLSFEENLLKYIFFFPWLHSPA
jgi:hypothetical protein